MSKAAIVTGSARGIGKAIAARLARDGIQVALVDINEEAVQASAREIARETGSETMAFRCDVSREEEVITAV